MNCQGSTARHDRSTTLSYCFSKYGQYIWYNRTQKDLHWNHIMTNTTSIVFSNMFHIRFDLLAWGIIEEGDAALQPFRKREWVKPIFFSWSQKSKRFVSIIKMLLPRMSNNKLQTLKKRCFLYRIDKNFQVLKWFNFIN